MLAKTKLKYCLLHSTVYKEDTDVGAEALKITLLISFFPGRYLEGTQMLISWARFLSEYY